jgi:ribonuclease D
MTIHLHKNDLSEGVNFSNFVAVDTEAMGLNNHRDRLCLVQLSDGDGDAHVVQFEAGKPYTAPRLKALLTDDSKTKIFHFARFDVAIMKKYLDIECTPLFCTKLASNLCRTYTDRHGLRDLCKEILDVDLNKQQQSSDWGQDDLTEDQLNYAASDVLYLHGLMDALKVRLIREGRMELAQSCFDFLMTRAQLDLEGWVDCDIFAHR